MVPKELEKATELKRRLFNFALSKRFRSVFRRELQKKFGKSTVAEEGEIINLIDWFLLEKKFPEGDTVVDRFVRYCPSLTKEEKETVLRWKDVTHGFFEVKRLIDHGFIVWNHLNEVEYIVKPNLESSSLGLEPGNYFLGRIVHLKDYYMISGAIELINDGLSRELLSTTIAKIQLRYPEHAFKDNPQRVQKGREFVKELHEAFVEYFGADEVVVRGEELHRTMEGFNRYITFEKVGKRDGKTPAQRAKEKRGEIPELPKFNYPPDLVAAEDLGILSDPLEGYCFIIGYSLFREIFNSEKFKKIKGYREFIIHYLKDGSVSPLPFKRARSRNPAIAEKVLQDVLKDDTFSIETDFDKLMRKYKSDWTDKERLPTIVPMGVVDER